MSNTRVLGSEFLCQEIPKSEFQTTQHKELSDCIVKSSNKNRPTKIIQSPNKNHPIPQQKSSNKNHPTKIIQQKSSNKNHPTKSRNKN
jgi:hypothetical protein